MKSSWTDKRITLEVESYLNGNIADTKSFLQHTTKKSVILFATRLTELGHHGLEITRKLLEV